MTFALQYNNKDTAIETKDELSLIYSEYHDTLNTVMGNYVSKEIEVGLTELDNAMYPHFVEQLDNVEIIIQKLSENNLDISTEIIGFIEAFYEVLELDSNVKLFYIPTLNDLYERALNN